MSQTKQQLFKAFKGRVNVPAEVPLTAQLYDEWSGEAGDCVQSAISNHGFRGFLGPVRSAIVDALEAAYPQNKRKTEKKNDKDVPAETDENYVARLVASEVITGAELQALADKAIAEKKITFESTLRASTTRGKLGDDWKEMAQSVIEAWERGTNDLGQPASVELSLEKIRKALPNATLSDPTSVEEVAFLLRDYTNALKKQSVV